MKQYKISLRILCFAILLIMLSQSIFAKISKFELFVGYRLVEDSIYKSTYGGSNFDAGIALSFGLFKGVDLRTEGSVLYDRGEMNISKEKIEFWQLTSSLGLRIGLEVTKILNPYIGGGWCFSWFNETARIGDTSDTAHGFQIELGDYLYLGKKYMLDLNFRYIKLDASPYDETIKLGGYRICIGICQIF